MHGTTNINYTHLYALKSNQLEFASTSHESIANTCSTQLHMDSIINEA